MVNPIPVTEIEVNSPACERDTLHFHAGGNHEYIWSGVNNFSATGHDVYSRKQIPGIQEIIIYQ